jgi:hypothetical protein
MMGTQAPITTKTTTTSGIVPPKIEVTTIYAMFKLMGGNRPIDYNHVKRLKAEMKANPHLLATNPISVNEHYYIIDGQHRHMAAQELGVPLYYILTPGIALDDTRSLNTTQKRWTLMDFARSYADSGREDYKTFVRLHSEFHRIAPSILRLYLVGKRGGNIELDFRRGDFEIDDLEKSRKWLQQLDSIITRTHVKMNSPMANAFKQLFSSNPDFDYHIFMAKLEHESARDLLRPQASLRGCLRSIEEVYNFQSKYQKRLY